MFTLIFIVIWICVKHIFPLIRIYREGDIGNEQHENECYNKKKKKKWANNNFSIWLVWWAKSIWRIHPKLSISSIHKYQRPCVCFRTHYAPLVRAFKKKLINIWTTDENVQYQMSAWWRENVDNKKKIGEAKSRI